jgi:hypothetical protein
MQSWFYLAGQLIAQIEKPTAGKWQFNFASGTRFMSKPVIETGEEISIVTRTVTMKTAIRIEHQAFGRTGKQDVVFALCGTLQQVWITCWLETMQRKQIDSTVKFPDDYRHVRVQGWASVSEAAEDQRSIGAAEPE